MLILFGWFFLSCEDDNPMDEGIDLTSIPYEAVSYDLIVPNNFAIPALNFPEMPIPEDNPLTVEGVELGRRLFYDPVLSADSTMSCAGCHFFEDSFTDAKAVSTGIDDIEGRRSSMSLLNLGYNLEGFFWDGRSLSLEDQAILPVEDPIELHNDWSLIEEKLQNSSDYRERFRKSFGIENSLEIDRTH